ncbi:ABC transporter ATP-binding protein [Alkalimonas amylolytica]|uniref:Putative ABC transport system ATP-binding protein n=1 Tax=Alkalimonas amylolytica TaxID=152573 RepID=A0A1H4CHS3_ALKAM|nr:ABC transporter ATP-binding protein [Alkalimonas amylolytica]SEA59894.1 putative ABC transport system ATP-binding protein [Alkalimonas amylolytica]
MSQAVIESLGLTKTYRMGSQQVHALAGVDVHIQQGEFIAVMGPSGSGKSTFMNMLGCLDSPSSGEIRIQGENVTHLSAAELARIRNRYIGFVFQQFNLLPRTTALDNVLLPLLYRKDHDGNNDFASECLRRVGLAERMDHHPSQLSGGQQQRVAIARALVNQPAVVLADEPTGALDTETGLEIMQLFQQLNQEGKTIVLVTHEPEVAAFASRQLIFRDGRLQSDKQVQAESASEHLARYRAQKQQEGLA